MEGTPKTELPSTSGCQQVFSSSVEVNPICKYSMEKKLGYGRDRIRSSWCTWQESEPTTNITKIYLVLTWFYSLAHEQISSDSETHQDWLFHPSSGPRPCRHGYMRVRQVTVEPTTRSKEVPAQIWWMMLPDHPFLRIYRPAYLIDPFPLTLVKIMMRTTINSPIPFGMP